MLVVTNARVMTCEDRGGGLGIVERGAVAIDGGRVVWVGAATELPEAWRGGEPIDGGDLRPAGSTAGGRCGVIDGGDLRPAGSTAGGRCGVIDGGDLRPAGSTAGGRCGVIDGGDLRPAGSTAGGRCGVIDGGDLRPAGSTAGGRCGVIDGGDLRPAGSTAGGRCGVIDGGDLRPAGSTAGGRCGVIDAGGRLLTPGLVDCHAHPLFAGDRAAEFAMRARGESYQAIAAAGGGISATLAPTRAATTAELVALTQARLRRAIACGTTTMEAKSGYDLTPDGEARLLEVARRANDAGPVGLEPTLLCHLVPPEMREARDRAAFVDGFARALVPRVARERLATSVDVYCDEGAFTLSETRTVLTAAREAGLAVRAHVGQFADLGGAELCAELGARSADHLEQISERGVRALAAAGVVGVMLPGACVQLRMAPPPVAALRAAGVALAVATDLNPGTSYCESLPIAMWLATTHYGLTVEETWLGVTRTAARALGRGDVGRIGSGARGDLALWDTDEPAAIPYRFGAALCAAVWTGGALAHGAVRA